MSDRTVKLPPHLWELLETMAHDMGIEPGALVNQAVFHWARTNGYFKPESAYVANDAKPDMPLNVQVALQEENAQRAEANAAFEEESESWFEDDDDEAESDSAAAPEPLAVSEETAVESTPRVIETAEAIDALGEDAGSEDESSASVDLPALRAAAAERIRQIAEDVAALTRPAGAPDDGESPVPDTASEGEAQDDDIEIDEPAAEKVPEPEAPAAEPVDVPALRAAAAERIREIAEDVAELTRPVGVSDEHEDEDEDEDDVAVDGAEPESASDDVEGPDESADSEVDDEASESEDGSSLADELGDGNWDELEEDVDMSWADSDGEEDDDVPVPAPEPPSALTSDAAPVSAAEPEAEDAEAPSDEPAALAAEADGSVSGVELDADLVSAPGLEDAVAPEEAPAWKETTSPEGIDTAPKPVVASAPVPAPVLPEPTSVDESESAGAARDFDQLLADLEDLESDVGTLAEANRTNTEALGGSTEVVESEAYLSLTVEGDRTVEVEKTPFVIGRTSSCDLQLRSERVSRQHAIIEKVGALGFRIVDKGSSNGVWFGAERVSERMIRDGDILRIGDRRVRATIRISAT
ncbi:MAG: FHA domain-containing protein [Myxococcota bacterium]